MSHSQRTADFYMSFTDLLKTCFLWQSRFQQDCLQSKALRVLIEHNAEELQNLVENE